VTLCEAAVDVGLPLAEWQGPVGLTEASMGPGWWVV